jgi:hypothetical protein
MRSLQQQQLVKSLSQPLMQSLEQLVEQQQQQQQYESLLDQNNNGSTVSLFVNGEPVVVVEPLSLEELYAQFATLKDVEQQELFVAELIQKYATYIAMPTELNQEYRKKIEQLYLNIENTRLGQLVRQRINEIGHLRKQVEQELQYGTATRYQIRPQQQLRQQPFGLRSVVYPTTTGGIYIPGTTGEYESLPTTSSTTTTTTTTVVDETPVQQQVQEIIQQQQQQKPSFKCVEQLINQLENKLRN